MALAVGHASPEMVLLSRIRCHELRFLHSIHTVTAQYVGSAGIDAPIVIVAGADDKQVPAEREGVAEGIGRFPIVGPERGYFTLGERR